MTEIIKYSTGTNREDFEGYFRVVRIDNEIITSGTTSTDENGNIIGIDNPYIQTKIIIKKIADVLKDLGANLHNVIKTVIYTTDILK